MPVDLRGTASGLRHVAAVVAAVLDALARAERASPTPPKDAESLRLLLVEDDANPATGVARELGGRGCLVRVTRAGASMRRTLEAWPCHAVVLDCWSQADTAEEIEAILRSDRRFAIVALVCFGLPHDSGVRRAALALGCDVVVSRNDGVDRLLDAILACVARPDRGAMTFR